MRWNRLVRSRAALCVLGWLGAWFLRGLGSTWRISIEGSVSLCPGPQSEPVLAAFWHRNILIAAFLFRDHHYSVPVSRSHDGDLITAVLNRLGYAAPPRGSSSGGGVAALRTLVKRLKAGSSVSIQTDGPRGPARVFKPGIVALARLSGIPISPIGFAASPRLSFRSWDRALLPLPFARVTSFSSSIPISGDLGSGERAAALRALDRELNRLTDELDRQAGSEIQGGG